MNKELFPLKRYSLLRQTDVKTGKLKQNVIITIVAHSGHETVK